ncbi:hypothetical protein EYF80_059846 [Liparis tanakae]|uniref:Uncharacterized protein n=1 Tax=Liparis tanakae TaxID=230148 RepID=A0A4Z2ENF7_9TELE|nr:hypothetical protein EYF80_059846 [Liparis tanakae]
MLMSLTSRSDSFSESVGPLRPSEGSSDSDRPDRHFLWVGLGAETFLGQAPPLPVSVSAALKDVWTGSHSDSLLAAHEDGV